MTLKLVHVLHSGSAHNWYMFSTQAQPTIGTCTPLWLSLASSPGHSQILSRSHGEKSGEGLVLLLHHGPEMVDLPSPPFPVCDVAMIPGLLLIFLHGCEINLNSGPGTRLGSAHNECCCVVSTCTTQNITTSECEHSSAQVLRECFS